MSVSLMMVQRRVQRLGFLGGTFDPVHLGHLLIAQDALEQMNLDRVYFVPARQNPFKQSGPFASDQHRIAMLELALAGKNHFSWLEWELDSSEPSYSVQTARRLRVEFPQAQCFWIIGTDQLNGLSQWKEVDELVQLVEFIVVQRPQHSLEIPCLPDLRAHPVTGHPFEVSSSEIRQRVREGKPVDFFLSPGVNSYVLKNQLYPLLND